jgi:uncharacterized membrane protein
MDNPTKGLTAFNTSAGGDWPSAVVGHMEKAERVSVAPYVMLVLALIGIADAFYVAHASYSGQSMWCPIVDGCNTVAQSPYARIFGVPLSYFGLAFYLSMFGLAALLAFDPFSRGLRFGVLLYTAIGVSYSVYGMYLQLSLIRAVCSYCLISAVITVLLFIAALRHFRATRIPSIIG